MKSLLSFGIFFGISMRLLTFPSLIAQTNLVLSNLDEPSAGAVAVASDSRLAKSFVTGDNLSTLAYSLDSVRLLMSAPTGNPSEISVAVHGPSRSPGPGDILEKLEGPTPLSSGIFSYSSKYPFYIGELNRYWIVVTSETPISEGAHFWNLASTENVDSIDGVWGLGSNYYSSSDGINWTRIDGNPLQFAIYATPNPRLSVNPIDNNQIEIRWIGVEGFTCQLQTRSAIAEGEWTDVGEPLTGHDVGLTATVPVNSGESQSYYRVAVLPAAPTSE